MKKYIAIGACLALAHCVYGQEQNTLEETVRASLVNGVLEGQRVKQLERGGDAVAVALTKVIGDKPLSDIEIETALTMLEEAFSRLNWVYAAADREPRAALFLLAALSCSSHTALVDKKIAEVKKLIINSAKSLQTAPK